MVLRRRFGGIAPLLALALIAACAAPNATKNPAEAGVSAPVVTRLAVAPNPPRIGAEGPADLVAAGRVAAAAPARIREARGLRYMEVSALPYLRLSPEGAAYLARPYPRALARGAPAESCPAAGVSAPGVANIEAATRGALGACLALLSKRGAPASCGCKILALDGALTAGQGDFSFATAVSALLIPRSGPPRSVIAESGLDSSGAEALLFRSAAGPVALGALTEDAAELRFGAAPGKVFRGVRQPFGYRRGRLAERLVLTAPDGEDLTVLIGVERRDAIPAR